MLQHNFISLPYFVITYILPCIVKNDIRCKMKIQIIPATVLIMFFDCPKMRAYYCSVLLASTTCTWARYSTCASNQETSEKKSAFPRWTDTYINRRHEGTSTIMGIHHEGSGNNIYLWLCNTAVSSSDGRMLDLRFSLQWSCKVLSSWTWHCVLQ